MPAARHSEKHSTGMLVSSPSITGENPRSACIRSTTGATATKGPRRLSASRPMQASRIHALRNLRQEAGRSRDDPAALKVISSLPLLSRRAPRTTAAGMRPRMLRHQALVSDGNARKTMGRRKQTCSTGLPSSTTTRTWPTASPTGPRLEQDGVSTSRLPGTVHRPRTPWWRPSPASGSSSRCGSGPRFRVPCWNGFPA